MKHELASVVVPTAAEGSVRAPAGAGGRTLFGVHLSELLKLGAVAFQFGLFVLLVGAFELESDAFLRLSVLAFGGFLVHHFLPLRWKLPFFAALSIAGIALVLGIKNAAFLVAAGVVLIALAHAPLAFWWRVALIVAAAGACALLRAKLLRSPVSGVVWLVLGSMFMFRMMAYLYDLKHKAAPCSPSRALAYFFMLPNVCFLLFPVVDYKKFCLSHYNADCFSIYQRGLVFLLRGTLQILVYRLVYQYLLVDPATLEGGGAALQLMLATYLLYLRISGTFHVIVGLLHLFGFNLSETHHLYLLASSFTDFWRRINIYWKDFIQKLFFNPAYFVAKRKLGATGGMALATIVAFFFTWILHSYQWFWIRGKFEITWQDTIFWWVLCFLVLGNVLVELRRPAQRSLKEPVRTWRSELRFALSTILTFLVICCAWTVWTASSFEELSLLLAQLRRITLTETAIALGGLALLGVGAVLFGRRPHTQTEVQSAAKTPAAAFPWGSAMRVAGVSALLLCVAQTPGLLAFAPDVQNAVKRVMSSDRLNRRDEQMLERGYYEDLVNVSSFSLELAALYRNQPLHWSQNRALRWTNGFPPRELIPSTRVQYKGSTLTTNSHGMRDREYTLAKPAGTLRLALLGASHSAGTGVEDDETFENLVEDRLNRERAGAPYARYEILNFSVGGCGPLSRLQVLEQQVLQFQPDVVIYEGVDDLTWLLNELAEAFHRQFPIPFEEVVAFARSVGVEPGVSRLAAWHGIAPRAAELLEWIYRRFVGSCLSNGVRPIVIFLPRPEEFITNQGDTAVQRELASRTGFTLIDMSTAYSGVAELDSLWIARWDRHPNSVGHRLLADKLYAGILTQVLAPAGR